MELFIDHEAKTVTIVLPLKEPFISNSGRMMLISQTPWTKPEATYQGKAISVSPISVGYKG